MVEARLPRAAVVLLVLGLGQPEVEQPAVGVDPVAAEAVEFADRGLRDALAEFACGLRGGGVAGGLHGLPELRGGGVGLLAVGLRAAAGGVSEGDRRGDGADGGTHDEAVERHAAV